MLVEKEIRNPIVQHSFGSANSVRLQSSKGIEALSSDKKEPPVLQGPLNHNMAIKGAATVRRGKAKVIVKSSLFPGATASASTKATTFHD